jgi:hypothetical protein
MSQGGAMVTRPMRIARRSACVRRAQSSSSFDQLHPRAACQIHSNGNRVGEEAKHAISVFAFGPAADNHAGRNVGLPADHTQHFQLRCQHKTLERDVD